MGQHRIPRQPTLLSRVGAAVEGLFDAGVQYAAGTRIKFTGTDRRGVPQHGAKRVVSVSVFVEDRYAAGWRDLTVLDVFGEPVGGIDRDDVTGRREWWADPAGGQS